MTPLSWSIRNKGMLKFFISCSLLVSGCLKSNDVIHKHGFKKGAFCNLCKSGMVFKKSSPTTKGRQFSGKITQQKNFSFIGNYIVDQQHNALIVCILRISVMEVLSSQTLVKINSDINLVRVEEYTVCQYQSLQINLKETSFLDTKCTVVYSFDY